MGHYERFRKVNYLQFRFLHIHEEKFFIQRIPSDVKAKQVKHQLVEKKRDNKLLDNLRSNQRKEKKCAVSKVDPD